MIVFLSPFGSFDERLDALGPTTSRAWDESWTSTSPDAVAAEVVAKEPLVVVIGPGVNEDIGLTWVEAFARQRSDTSIVMVGDMRTELVVGAMRAGASDVVAPNVSHQELVDTLDRARDAATRRRESTIIQDEAGGRGKVIVVLSPKGGAGKTTVSSNLAVGLAEELGAGEVGLLDLDVQFGDLSHAMSLMPEHNLGDAALASRQGLDTTTLKIFLTHHRSGAFVLPAPESLVQAEDVHAEHVKMVLDLMTELFPVVIVDTASGIGEHALMAIEFATDVLFVASPDTPTIRALRREVEAFELIGLVSAQRHLIVNRVEGRGGIGVGEIESTIGLPVSHQIPRSRGVVVSTDEGVPILEDGGRDPAAKALRDLVQAFVPGPSLGRGRFGRKRER
ncbi:MAG: P-loop NTPase [Actinomycetota bacterium]